MIIINTKLIPMKKIDAINLFGILIVPKGLKINRQTVIHEAIHTAQMKEMLYIFFYLWYFFEWLIRLFCKGNAYRNISLEKEAYHHDHDRSYLKNRKHYNWLRFL
jgi:hypothetical protein